MDEDADAKEPETDWLPASEALEQLHIHHNGPAATKLLLSDLLRDGKLRARARRAFVSTAKDIDRAWKARLHPDGEFDYDIELRRKDFRDSRTWIADLHDWVWPESRFVITLKVDPIERYFYENVEFASEDIKRLEPSVSIPAPAGRGGRRPDMARWTNFWLQVVHLAKAGKLHRGEFSSQAELSEEIRDMMGSSPLGEDAVKDRIRQIWVRFIEGEQGN